MQDEVKSKDSCVQRLHENTLDPCFKSRGDGFGAVLPLGCQVLKSCGVHFPKCLQKESQDADQSTIAKTQSDSKLAGLQDTASTHAMFLLLSSQKSALFWNPDSSSPE